MRLKYVLNTDPRAVVNPELAQRAVPINNWETLSPKEKLQAVYREFREFPGSSISAWINDAWERLNETNVATLKNDTPLLVEDTRFGQGQVLEPGAVLARLTQLYRNDFQQRISERAGQDDPRRGPIPANSAGDIENLGSRLKLEGYRELGLRALMGLMVLQSRSSNVNKKGKDNEDDKFSTGTQFLRTVGAPGTGKSTILDSVWSNVFENLDDLCEELRKRCDMPVDDPAIVQIRERIKSSLAPQRLLSFTFSNSGLTKLEAEEQDQTITGNFMATRMLYAMVGARGISYAEFLRRMDASLRRSLTPGYLMDFIHGETGISRGLVVWNFDECGAPLPGADGVTYFQHGLSSLVEWRRDEAFRALCEDSTRRDMLPVIVIAGSHSSRMSLLRTATGRAKMFHLGRPLLDDDSLTSAAKDALDRIAQGTGREVPNTASEILEQLIPWLGWNPRTLVWMLQALANRRPTASPRSSPLNVDRLWEFLQLRHDQRLDALHRVLDKLQDSLRRSNWATWLCRDEDKETESMFMQLFAHSVVGWPVARDAKIGDNDLTFADAENDGFIALTEIAAQAASMEVEEPREGAGTSMATGAGGTLAMDEGDAAPDAMATVYVHIPPLLLRVMHSLLNWAWANVRMLAQLSESWQDRERTDLSLFMLRLQLVSQVLKRPAVDLSRLYPGLQRLGKIVVPTGGYTINNISEHLDAASFKKRCLDKASPGDAWAYLGPGNWGPDAWLILFSATGSKPVCVFLQSKKRSDVLARYHKMYPEGVLAAEAGKCWSVEGVPACLLYLTDERGREAIPDNEPLDTAWGINVVPITRGSYQRTYGVALETLKRCCEVLEYQNEKRQRHK